MAGVVLVDETHEDQEARFASVLTSDLRALSAGLQAQLATRLDLEASAA